MTQQRTGLTITCRNCQQEVKKINRWGMNEWTHAASDDDKCKPGDPWTGRAYPEKHCEPCGLVGTEHSHCPKCGEFASFRFWEDAWANNWACDNCGYASRYSLGD